jgi:putative Ca2+/H+ antiporter (TMEM165/GDT1 family)
LTSAKVSFAEVVLLTTWAVLIAELVGDRSMYALASLALRFRWAVVFVAFTVANAAKMAIAVLLAHAIAQFQSRWTYLVSAIAFFISAILIWEDESLEIDKPSERATWAKGLLVSFGAFFLTEWGDPGQIAAAALVLKFHMSIATWIGATLGLMLKGAVAIVLGLQIRHRLPLRALRILSSASCCFLGILATIQGVIA